MNLHYPIRIVQISSNNIRRFGQNAFSVRWNNLIFLRLLLHFQSLPTNLCFVFWRKLSSWSNSTLSVLDGAMQLSSFVVHLGLVDRVNTKLPIFRFVEPHILFNCPSALILVRRFCNLEVPVLSFSPNCVMIDQQLMISYFALFPFPSSMLPCFFASQICPLTSSGGVLPA